MLKTRPVVFLVIVCFGSFDTITAENVTITIPGGQIMGMTTQSTVTANRTFWSFLGVRYAEPPVNGYRFVATAEVYPWEGVYDATSEKSICHSAMYDSPLENEDCLYLNVFSPRDPLDTTSEYLPVMFHIHGGGFNQGSGTITSGFGPDFFMDYEVVLVSINYRLGVFGFLSTGDNIISGNQGLKDQLLALQWVQKNIKYFGGDPNRVTIFGQEAGAASVALHLLSAASNGLFHGAIMESGSALSPWAFQSDVQNIVLSTAKLFDPPYMNYNLSVRMTSREFLIYYQISKEKDMDKAQTEMQSSVNSGDSQLTQGFLYAPVIEEEWPDAFLTREMYEMFERGNYNQVPVIIGINVDEGLILYDNNTGTLLSYYDTNPEAIVPNNMNADQGNKKTIAEAIKNQYSPNSNWADNSLGGINFYTDTCFARSVIKQAELQSKYNDVYFYMFDYHGEMGQSNRELAGTENVTNGEELAYLFTRTVNKVNNSDLSQFSKEDLNTHYRMMRLWTDFAKYQKPVVQTDDLVTVDWPTIGSNFEYMNIATNLSLKSGPKSEAYTFWTDLYSHYSVPPLITY